MTPHPTTPSAASDALPDAAAVARWLRRASALEAAPWLHAEVARRMATRLSIVKAQPAKVLDWWSALGGSGALLREHYPKAEIERVEPVPAFAARAASSAPAWWQARRWLGRTGHAAHLESQLPGDTSAGLVWANMMLHWSTDPAQTFARWHRALAVDGFVMFSCFGPDTLRGLRELYAERGLGAPSQRFIDMHDLGDAMVHAGFADPVMDMEKLVLTWPDAGAMLAELRTLGVNAAHTRASGLRTSGWRRKLESDIEVRLGTGEGRVSMEFEIVFGHAFRPVPRARVAAQTRVSVEDMRMMARRKPPPGRER
jgi:malonyl-CoA O-methyltransferase